MRFVMTGVLLLGMLLVLAPQCSREESVEKGVESQAKSTPAVFGVVRESSPKGMPPSPPTKPGRLVAGAVVDLLEFAGKEELAGPKVTGTVTDSLGSYRLQVPPGKYFLIVSKAQIRHPRYTTGYMGKNFAAEDSINVFKTVEVKEESVEIDLVLPQGWGE